MYVLHVHVHEQFQCIRDHKKQGKVSKKSAYMYMYTCMSQVAHQAPVVQRLDNAIHRINRYPVDKC